MSAEDAFATLKEYLETRPAARRALSALKPGVEISVVVGGTIDCAVFQQGGQPSVEKRPAQSPDVVFQIRPETVYVLSKQPGEDVGEVGISILKEVLAGNIQIRVPGSFFNIMRNGYLDVIKQGGGRFMSFLAQHGLSSVTKIISAIKNMKK